MLNTQLHKQLAVSVKVSFLLALFALALFTLVGCSEEAERQPVRLQGQIYGTFWLATLPDEWTPEQVKQLKAGIEGELNKVDEAMSTYKPNSELNRFNAAPLGEWVELSADLFEVFNLSQTVSKMSQGAFDVTIGDLVNLWNFGPEARPEAIPEAALLKKRLTAAGFQYLELNAERQAARRFRASFVDLSGVAKGYAVDKVAQWLQQQGVGNFLINIGGEIVVAGQRAPEQPWRIGIEVPDDKLQAAQHVVPLVNESVATSGDYRNFYELDGKRMSHTINPKTGWPIDHNLTSVTVFHSSNAVADAWATAFMVMGAEASLALANRENLKVLLISKVDKAWKTQVSNSLQQKLGTELTNKILN